VNVSLPAGAFAPTVQVWPKPFASGVHDAAARLRVARIVEPRAIVTDCALAETSSGCLRDDAARPDDGAETTITKYASFPALGAVAAELGAGVGVAAGIEVGVADAAGVDVAPAVGVACKAAGRGFDAPPLHAQSANVSVKSAMPDELRIVMSPRPP
jgi:hypothetical protein